MARSSCSVEATTPRTPVSGFQSISRLARAAASDDHDAAPEPSEAQAGRELGAAGAHQDPRAEDHARETALARELLDDSVSFDFRPRVRPAPLGMRIVGGLLGDRVGLGRHAVDPDRAHVHEALDARRRRRRQAVTRPGAVVPEAVGAVTGAGNPRRTVDDRVHTLERLPDARVVAAGGHDLFHVLPLLAEAGEANHGAAGVTALTERPE